MTLIMTLINKIMSGYANLKTAISQAIKPNGRQETTASVLQNTLNSIINNSIGTGSIYVGQATPSTNPGNPDANVFYIASAPGVYSNFGGIVLDGTTLTIISNITGSWVASGVFSISIDGRFIPLIEGQFNIDDCLVEGEYSYGTSGRGMGTIRSDEYFTVKVSKGQGDYIVQTAKSSLIPDRVFQRIIDVANAPAPSSFSNWFRISERNWLDALSIVKSYSYNTQANNTPSAMGVSNPKLGDRIIGRNTDGGSFHPAVLTYNGQYFAVEFYYPQGLYFRNAADGKMYRIYEYSIKYADDIADKSVYQGNLSFDNNSGVQNVLLARYKGNFYSNACVKPGTYEYVDSGRPPGIDDAGYKELFGLIVIHTGNASTGIQGTQLFFSNKRNYTFMRTFTMNSDETGAVFGNFIQIAGTAEIPDKSITSNKIADLAVTSTKIAPLAVAGSNIVDSAISTAKIANKAISANKLSDDLNEIINDAYDYGLNYISVAPNLLIRSVIEANTVAIDGNSVSIYGGYITVYPQNGGEITYDRYEMNSGTFDLNSGALLVARLQYLYTDPGHWIQQVDSLLDVFPDDIILAFRGVVGGAHWCHPDLIDIARKQDNSRISALSIDYTEAAMNTVYLNDIRSKIIANPECHVNIRVDNNQEFTDLTTGSKFNCYASLIPCQVMYVPGISDPVLVISNAFYRKSAPANNPKFSGFITLATTGITNEMYLG